jgi:hypothetical protein
MRMRLRPPDGGGQESKVLTDEAFTLAADTARTPATRSGPCGRHQGAEWLYLVVGFGG